MINKRLFIFFLTLCISFSAFAQNNCSVKLKLVDAAGEPVAYATVYVSPDGTTKDAFYALTDDKGKATIEKAPKGKYIFKAELMGYKTISKDVTLEKNVTDLGELKMEDDVTLLDQAVVSAVGNPIVVKKDTIEYNADSFKTTDNDMLEELLKKLPGIEVGTDGAITANGKTINKITIDGRTFFLDDPQLATKNIPAKIIKKVKVVEKKSEQAEFTGIDDGEEETIIDLNIRPGMMKGWFGNITGGAGKDITEDMKDTRWQGSGMVGRFTDKSQISIIGNGNNTNNRGFQDMQGDMMASMRGGGGMGMGGGRGMMGGGNTGITTSWMGGLNANSYFLDNNAMEFGGNYVYNGTDRYVTEESAKTTFVDENKSLYSLNSSESTTWNEGHRGGVEMDWDINDKTSILFRPQVNFGNGHFSDESQFSSVNTYNNSSARDSVNRGYSLSSGDNTSWRTNGRLLYRQKIGNTSGRTISLNIDYSLSNNDMDGINKSLTLSQYDENNIAQKRDPVDQYYKQNQKSYSLSGNLTYTEPLGKNFFLQASYRYGWSRNNSLKNTFDTKTGIQDLDYSNKYSNDFVNQNISLNMMKQEEKYNLQIGFSAQPSSTKSVRTIYSMGGDSKVNERDSVISYSVWNFAPSARFDYRFSDSEFLRINYRGQTSQPSINQLSPVKDNSNPLYISRGNAHLQPSFSHRLGTDYRKTNMNTFASIGTNINLTYTKDAIINVNWYDGSGVQYSAPVNAKGPAFSASGMIMFDSPIAKSKFSVMSFTNVSASSSLSYTGTIEDADEETPIEDILKSLVECRTTNLNVGENLYFVYRDNYVEARLGGRAQYSNAWYNVSGKTKTATWNNQISADVTGTMPWGTEIRTDASYNFYIGYEAGYGDPKLNWNAEISQLIFKNKMTIRFKVYDILNQAITNRHTNTDNYIQDTMNNTLGRYFMLSLTFRFGNFGNAGNNMHGGPGRGGRMGGGPMGGPPRR